MPSPQIRLTSPERSGRQAYDVPARVLLSSGTNAARGPLRLKQLLIPHADLSNFNGFIDLSKKFTTYNERDARRGTQITFLTSTGEFGGLYFTANGAFRGFWVLDGDAHTLNAPNLGPQRDKHDTVIAGADSSGVFYGTTYPPGKSTSEGFAEHNGTFDLIHEPNQKGVTDLSGTFISDSNSSGVICGSYTYDGSSTRVLATLRIDVRTMIKGKCTVPSQGVGRLDPRCRSAIQRPRTFGACATQTSVPRR